MQFLDPESWRKYIFEQGPSPVQSLVVGNADVSNVSQILEDPAETTSKWQNIVDFGEGNALVIEAAIEGVRDESSFFYRFSGGKGPSPGAIHPNHTCKYNEYARPWSPPARKTLTSLVISHLTFRRRARVPTRLPL